MLRADHAGQISYVRPLLREPKQENDEEVLKRKVDDEVKSLRFSHQRTAFDVDIDSLEAHPWRRRNVNMSDFFNYGFDEDSWRVSYFILDINCFTGIIDPYDVTIMNCLWYCDPRGK